MKQAEARERVWRRLAVTARNDATLGDWIYDETDNEPDRRRLLKACVQIAKSIERKVTKSAKG